SASATGATRSTKATASTKSWKRNALTSCSRLPASSIHHPSSWATSGSTCSAVSGGTPPSQGTQWRRSSGSAVMLAPSRSQLAREVAGCQVAAPLVLQRRVLLGAYGELRDRAAGVEAAAARRVDGGGDLAPQEDRPALGLEVGVGDRDRAQQGLGVGVHRIGVDRPGVRHLDDLPEV